jgi:acyl-CoA reductase-like NAD-dependent aldehyde dehydrogenase
VFKFWTFPFPGAGEVARGIENVEFAAGLSHLLKGEHSEQVSRSLDVHQVKQPVGVVGAITPFNFPVMVALWMAASAIAFGNAVILKPSKKDPSAAAGDIADILIDKIKQRAADLAIGPGIDPNSEIGPLFSADARARVARYIDGAPSEGATVALDGRGRTFGSNGYFIGVSLLDHVRPGMAAYDDEIFGPVLSVVRVETFDDAVALTNANRYGNGAAIFTRDGKTAREFEFAVEAGMVGKNVPVPVPVGTYSFGGWKASLFGDSHIYGPESVHFYTRSKVITTRWPQPSESQIDLGFPSNN